MIERLKLKRNLLLVKLEEKEQKTKAGIIIPMHENVQYCTAKVVGVGEGKIVDGKKVPLQVTLGDIVLLGNFKALEIEDHLLITDEDVLGILQ